MVRQRDDSAGVVESGRGLQPRWRPGLASARVLVEHQLLRRHKGSDVGPATTVPAEPSEGGLNEQDTWRGRNRQTHA
jgi:hypothetical protein